MKVTELLVCGYDGDKAVFAANLTAGIATTVITSTDGSGDVRVEATAEQATQAFASVRELLEGLAVMSARE